MFYRNISLILEEWRKRPDRKPLVLRGARQTGKTTLVNMFSKEFKSYVYLNLERQEDRTIFENDYPFRQVLESIFFLKKINRVKGSTLIFVDEIQNSPKAVMLLRYFYEEASDIHVIAAGSLLETLIDRHLSFPVGRVEYLAVRPCSFDEFLGATGEKLSQEAINQWPFPSYAHTHLSSLFNRYALIGGMPGVLENYAQNLDLLALNRIYQSLLTTYLDDVEKYASRNSAVQHIRHILRAGFKYGGQRIKFERFGESDYRSREMGEAFRILEKTMLAELVYPTGSVELPWLPNYKKSPRLHWLDTGLLNYSAGIQTEVFGVKELSSAWRGIVAEHVTGQELMANNHDVLYQRTFWLRESKNSNAEIDYLIPFEGLLIPVEVKSTAGTTLKSLQIFMDQAPHHLAVRVWSQPYRTDRLVTPKGKYFTLVSIPFYLIAVLTKILKTL